MSEIEGGQDRKYKFENGHFVNRLSGEPIPHDEPIMILRARNLHGLAMLKDYKFMVRDPKHQEAIQDRIDEFEEFLLNNPERMKEPGITGHIELNKDRTEGIAEAEGHPS